MPNSQQSTALAKFVRHFVSFTFVAPWTSDHNVVRPIAATSRQRHNVIGVPVPSDYLFVAVVAFSFLALQLRQFVGVIVRAFSPDLQRSALVAVFTQLVQMTFSPVALIPMNLIGMFVLPLTNTSGVLAITRSVPSIDHFPVFTVVFSGCFYALFVVCRPVLTRIFLDFIGMVVSKAAIALPNLFGIVKFPLSTSRFYRFTIFNVIAVIASAFALFAKCIAAKGALLMGNQLIQRLFKSTNAANLSSHTAPRNACSYVGVGGRYECRLFGSYPSQHANYTIVTGVIQ